MEVRFLSTALIGIVLSKWWHSSGWSSNGTDARLISAKWQFNSAPADHDESS